MSHLTIKAIPHSREFHTIPGTGIKPDRQVKAQKFDVYHHDTHLGSIETATGYKDTKSGNSRVVASRKTVIKWGAHPNPLPGKLSARSSYEPTKEYAIDHILRSHGIDPRTVKESVDQIDEGKKRVGALSDATKKRLARVKKVAASMQKKTNEEVLDEMGQWLHSGGKALKLKKIKDSDLENHPKIGDHNTWSVHHGDKHIGYITHDDNNTRVMSGRLHGGTEAGKRYGAYTKSGKNIGYRGMQFRDKDEAVNALADHHGIKESVEQIDELSKNTMKNYVAKSISQQKDITKTSTRKFDRKPFGMRTDKDYAEQDARSKTFYKRFRGSEMAKKKLAKEEVVRIDEASKKIISNYIAKISRD